MEYLGFSVTRNGIRTVNKKLEDIVNMTPPTTKIHVRMFIGLFNYYWEMWARRLHLLQNLTEITSDKAI